MNLDNLQKGFFGYKKSSVYEYISSMEEEFSERLLEKDGDAKKKEEEYKEKIRQLESELQDVRKQLDGCKKEQMMIGDTLMDAKRYAEELKKKAYEEEEKERRKWEQAVAQNNLELDNYQKKISEVREHLIKTLQNMDEKAAELGTQIQEIKEECPNRNMTLFKLKDENEN